MAEIRKVRIKEIEEEIKYEPDIPSNWYVPARQAWKFIAWFINNIKLGNTFRNDRDMFQCIREFHNWVEDYAVAFGKENEDGTQES